MRKIFLVLIFAMFSYLLFFSLFDIKAFAVTSGSMDSNISKGSLIYTTGKDEYIKNDIITFKNNGSFVTHRIVETVMVGSEKYFLTKGDLNTAFDNDLVNKNKITGKVDFSIPFLGSILMFLRTPTGFAAGIVLPTMIFLVSEILVLKRRQTISAY